jgi:hypothetical protein
VAWQEHWRSPTRAPDATPEATDDPASPMFLFVQLAEAGS